VRQRCIYSICFISDNYHRTQQFTTEDNGGSSTASYVTGYDFLTTTEIGVSTTPPSNDLSVGAIFGIVIAVIAVIFIIGVIVLIITWKRRKKKLKGKGNLGS
jgi:hypothetical protein